MKKEREIIGYKPKSDKYNSAIDALSDGVPVSRLTTRDYYSLIGNSYSIQNFEEAGVLDLWFDPVYDQPESTFKVGDFVICIGNYISQGYKSAKESKALNYGGSGYQKGKMFQIGSVSEEVLWPIGKFSGLGIYKYAVRLMTSKEIKESENQKLLEEANKRYPIGTRFTSLEGYGSGTVTEANANWDSNSIWIASDNSGGEIVCYKNGVWATILPNEPSILIKGHKAEFSKDKVKFGCQTYSKEFILTLNTCLQENNFSMQYKREIETMAEHFQQ